LDKIINMKKPKFKEEQIVQITLDEFVTNVSNRPVDDDYEIKAKSSLIRDFKDRKKSPQGGIILAVSKGYTLKEEFLIQNTHSMYHTTSCGKLTTLKEFSDDGDFTCYVYRLEVIQPYEGYTSNYLLCKENQLELSTENKILSSYEQ